MPREGGAVLVCNHTDFLDPIILGLYSGRALTFMAKAELLDEQWFGRLKSLPEKMRDEYGLGDEMAGMLDELSRVFRQLSQDLTILPIIRNFRDGSARGAIQYYKRALFKAVRYAKKGHVVVVFPEGTRQTGSGLGLFKGFAARIAIQAGVPMVPAALNGSQGISDLKARMEGGNRHSSVIYRIGPAIIPEQFPEGEGKAAIKSLTRMARQRVGGLLNK